MLAQILHECKPVANNTRADGREFIAEAVRANIQTQCQVFPLEYANEALLALKQDAIRGAGVLVTDCGDPAA